jgi:hypothetical protein
LLDLHLYQVFDQEDKQLSLEGHIAKTFKWKRTIDNFGAQRILVGEWSAVLDGIYEKMPQTAAIEARKLYTQAQLFAFSETVGNFYWNYKTEETDIWNYKSLQA